MSETPQPPKIRTEWQDGTKGEKKCECGGSYTASEYGRHMKTDSLGKNEHNDNMEKKKGKVNLG